MLNSCIPNLKKIRSVKTKVGQIWPRKRVQIFYNALEQYREDKLFFGKLHSSLKFSENDRKMLGNNVSKHKRTFFGARKKSKLI